MESITRIQTNITSIRQRIQTVANACDRPLDDILILGVTKGQPATAIQDAFSMGITHFGESYIQEARVKQQALAHLPITWHFIGRIQSNKTQVIAQHFDWVHGIDRTSIAERLNAQRPATLPPLNVCIQINIDHESSKAGVSPEQTLELAKSLQALTHLSLRGLMCIPDPSTQPEQRLQTYLRLQELLHLLKREIPGVWDTLSMGMSDDYDTAIRAGSNILRLGRVLFGQRQ